MVRSPGAILSNKAAALGILARLSALAIVVFASAWGSIALTHDTGRIAAIWAANAVVVAVLLRVPTRNWPAYFAAGLAGSFLANLASDDNLPLALGLSACNGTEILLAAGGMRRLFRDGDIDLTRPRTFLVFCVFVAVTPLVAGGCAAGLMWQLRGAPPRDVLSTWYLADALGLLTVTPLLLSVHLEDLRALLSRRQRVWTFAALGLLAAILAVSFGQSRYPLLFPVFPVLIFVAFRLGFAGVAIGIAMTAAAALLAIKADVGPFSLIDGSMRETIVVLQVFLTLAAIMSLQVAATLAERRRLTEALREANAAAQAAQTELASNAARYRTLVDALPQMVWLAEPDGAPTFLNGAMRAYHGEVELSPTLCAELVHPEDLPPFLEAKHEALAGGDGFEIESRLTDRSGRYRWHRLSVRPIRNARGDVLEIVGAALDIDDLRRTQDELTQALDRAEAAGRAKSDFLANMSHELRTPLTAVIGASELLLSGYGANDPVKQRRYLEMQRDAGTGLLEIINDILDFSKIEADQLDLEAVPFALAGIAEGSLNVVADLAARKNLSVSVSVSADLPAHVRGDPTRVRQVLLNLLSNAVKFTPTGGSVKLDVAQDETRPDGVRFSVGDTGIGIPREKLDQLFDRFTQAESSTSRRFGGSGLGLAISHRLVALMGGTFTVESTQGAGSTFTFSLPLEAEQAAPDHRRTEVPVEGHSRRRLLLAEDSEMNQKIIGAMLRKAGHEVVVVGNGAEAVEAALETSFDLILMDVQMPEVDGYSATQTIREARISASGRPVPIIALTANALSDEPDRCRSAGMDAHMSKPVDWPMLLATIEALTAMRRAA